MISLVGSTTEVGVLKITPKRGLRIDHIWVTKKLNTAVKASGIDYDIRGMDKPSDHAPIWTEFNL